MLSAQEVYAFGKNENGELGDGGTSNNSTPTIIKGLAHVTAISAGNTHALALLESGTAPPAPQIALQAEHGALRLRWTLSNAEKLLYRVFERPGIEEAEEEPEEAEPAEVDAESGTGATAPEAGPPKNTARPKITGEAREGKTLTATQGGWSGTEPITYEYQWQRCKAGECTGIAGATRSTYLVGSEDPGSTLRVVVTAENSVQPPGSATSGPTEVVKTEEEARKSIAESRNLNGSEHAIVINELNKESPLEAIPYEIKLRAGKVTRTLIGTPLP